MSSTTTKSRNTRALLTTIASVAFALSACDGDTTPIVDGSTPSLGMSLQSKPGLPSQADALAGSQDVKGPPDYRLGANDRMRIIVLGQDRLTGEYVLDGNGMLAFPLVGQLPASGLSSAQLEKAIAAKLDPDFIRDPSVSIEVLTRRPFFILGEVQKPGSYPHLPDVNVLTAVALAGGFTYRASENQFFIKRIDRDGRMVRVKALSETVVRPGDIVQVKERYF